MNLNLYQEDHTVSLCCGVVPLPVNISSPQAQITMHIINVVLKVTGLLKFLDLCSMWAWIRAFLLPVYLSHTQTEPTKWACCILNRPGPIYLFRDDLQIDFVTRIIPWMFLSDPHPPEKRPQVQILKANVYQNFDMRPFHGFLLQS